MQPGPQTNAQLRARMEELLGEYEQLQHNMSTTRERMRRVSGTAVATGGIVTVRVDSNARLTELTIDPKAYHRFSPSQLAAEIQRLYGEAAKDVTAQVGTLMAPFLPAGVSYEGLLTGDVDTSDWVIPQPLTDETFDEWRARFSGHRSAGPSSEDA